MTSGGAEARIEAVVGDALNRVARGQTVFVPTTPSISSALILSTVGRQAAERALAVSVSQSPAGVYVACPRDDPS
jgi:hypothetical protein